MARRFQLIYRYINSKLILGNCLNFYSMYFWLNCKLSLCIVEFRDVYVVASGSMTNSSKIYGAK